MKKRFREFYFYPIDPTCHTALNLLLAIVFTITLKLKKGKSKFSEVTHFPIEHTKYKKTCYKSVKIRDIKEAFYTKIMNTQIIMSSHNTVFLKF